MARVVGIVRCNGIIRIIGVFGIRILGVRTIRVAGFRVIARVGIAGVRVGVIGSSRIRVGIFGIMVGDGIFGISGVKVRSLGIGVRVGIRIGNIRDSCYPISISDSCLGFGAFLELVTSITTLSLRHFEPSRRWFFNRVSLSQWLYSNQTFDSYLAYHCL